jgi:hypothetical protein
MPILASAEPDASSNAVQLLMKLGWLGILDVDDRTGDRIRSDNIGSKSKNSARSEQGR